MSLWPLLFNPKKTLYTYIRGVTVHKIHGSIRYDKWCHSSLCFQYGGGGGAIGYIAMLEIFVLNHEGEPMDIKQAHVCTRVCTRANFVQDLCR